jgi:hypothetical protein
MIEVYTTIEFPDGWAVCLKENNKPVVRGFITRDTAEYARRGMEQDAEDGYGYFLKEPSDDL